MATVCIYCKRSTEGDKTRAHVFPEALGNKKFVLAPGTVCKWCNNYCGHALEAALVAHPTIAMAVHFWGVPGKGERVRTKLGTVKRQPSEAGTVSMGFGVAAPKLTFHADGSVEMESKATTPKGFRLDLFRRALHCIGVNVVARLQGADQVLDARFDAVRAYVRRPKSRTEAWPYAENNPPTKTIPPVVGANLIETSNGRIVALQLFQTFYAVDLLNSGDLAAAAEQHGAKVVGCDVTELPEVVIRMRMEPQPPPAT